MSSYEYSKWDGSQEFTPQSADPLFDQLSQFLMDYGDEVLRSLEDREEQNQDVIDLMVKAGYLEKDEKGQFQVTPKGMRRVENKALEALFDVSRKDKMGRHETEFRGAGQTMHDEHKPYEYGDPVANLHLQETLKNALHRQGGGSPVRIMEDDLVVYDTEYQTSCATVVLLGINLPHGEHLPCGMILWSAGFARNPLIASLEVEKDASGRIFTEDTLQLPAFPEVYALGDCTRPQSKNLPQLAQVAEQQGRYLATSLNARARGRAASPFVWKPWAVSSFLGGGAAVAELRESGSKLSGFWAYQQWRAATWTHLVSVRSKLLVPADRLRAFLFGREISRL